MSAQRAAPTQVMPREQSAGVAHARTHALLVHES
jgi:hypothetical protein